MSWNERLSQIDTLWTVVRRAHVDQTQQVKSAQEELLERYGKAARRYLLGALRDEDAAGELYQEFALRFVRGDFRNANPEKGRFRQFLKKVLFNLIVDHQKKRKRNFSPDLQNPGLEPAQKHIGPDDDLERDQQFTQHWRDELLSRAWAALKDYENQSGKMVYSVLRCRVEHPDLRSPELAEQLAADLAKPITAGNVRVLLHRARQQFADLLLEEVIQSLDTNRLEDVEEELADLNLLEYCRPALQRKPSQEE